MTRGLGWLQLKILEILRSDPERVWLYDDVAAEVYGRPWEPLQFQALYNAMRSLARRNLVVLNPQCLTKYGFPEGRQRARLA
jgi:hypothetical protein